MRFYIDRHLPIDIKFLLCDLSVSVVNKDISSTEKKQKPVTPYHL